MGVGKGFFDTFKVLCDGFKSFGSLLLLLSRFLGCLGNGICILRIILSIEQLLVGLCHRLLNLIDHIQSAVGVLGCLQLSGIENVLLGRHFQKSFLQFLDALIDLFLLFGILLRRRLWVCGFLLKFFGLLRGDLSEFRNRGRKLREQFSSSFDCRLSLGNNGVEIAEELLQFWSSIEHGFIVC